MKDLILVTGSEGLVGSRYLEISDHKKLLHTPKSVEFDITDKSEVDAVVASYGFETIINFAANTDVPGAEKQRNDKDGSCWQVNVEGVRNLAEAVKKQDGKVRLIQISTDMSMSGDETDKGPYSESHLPEEDLNKVTWYGYTKGLGETIVRETLGDSATILRIIYPVRAKFDAKLDYLRKPLTLFDQGKLYPMFDDQQISVSFIDEVCVALDRIISSGKHGTFHASSRDTVTPHQLISYMLQQTRGVEGVVKPIKLDEFIESTHSPSYRYPKYGGLAVEETQIALDMTFSGWREIVDSLIKQGLGKND